MSCPHGRFSYKLRPLQDAQSLRNVIFRLQEISQVLCFCMYSKQKNPEHYRIYVKMRRKSRISVFDRLKGLLACPPYGPGRKIVKNLALHYGSRKECHIYFKDDDDREQKEVEIYIEERLLDNDTFGHIMEDAIGNRDRRLFFTLLKDWKYYIQIENIIQSTLNHDFSLCKLVSLHFYNIISSAQESRRI